MTAYAERTEGTTIPWWVVLLEGIAAVVIGILLLTAPGITLLALVQVTGFFWLIGLAVLPFVLGAFSFIGGILAIIAAFAIRRGLAAGDGEARPA